MKKTKLRRNSEITNVTILSVFAAIEIVRAFTYFTLVRAFRDVPFIINPTIDDTQEFQMAQSDPDELIDWLIDDLKGAESTAVTSWSNTAYTKGRITQNAIRAIIADMCLWRGRYDEYIRWAGRQSVAALADRRRYAHRHAPRHP